MKGFLFACLAVAAFAVPGSIANALDNSFLLQEEPPPPNPTGITSGGGSVSQWRKAKASWYTGPTDRTADGTRMRLDGQWVATRLVPMGCKIEIRNKKGQTWIIQRRDTPDVKCGHRLDLPKGFWKTVTGAKPSTGLVGLEWRPVR